jgi:alpha-L-rhamnosidase
MQGAFTSWYYSHILGINPTEENPGFKEILFRPYVFDGIDNAEGSYESIYGKISASWKKDVTNGTFEYNVELPPNTSGTIVIPAVNGFKNTSIECFNEKGNVMPAIDSKAKDIAFSASNGKYKVIATF